MTTEHPVIPSSLLIEAWHIEWGKGKSMEELLTEAVQYGADEELKACCNWLKTQTIGGRSAVELRMIRRPKSKKLKERAIEALTEIAADEADHEVLIECFKDVRRALEALPDD